LNDHHSKSENRNHYLHQDPPDRKILKMNLPVNEIKTLLNELAANLCNSIESGDREKALAAQKAFTDTIAALWTSLSLSEVDLKLNTS
jgi:hypothetical protein